MRKKAVKGLKELEAAEKRAPQSAFVQSCRKFLMKRGFLSPEQVRALTFAGTPNRRARQFEYLDDHDPFQWLDDDDVYIPD